MPITLQQVDTGTAPGSGDGDPGRTAFEKVNANSLLLETVIEDAELKSFVIALGAPDEVVAVAENIDGFRMPFSFVLTEVRAEVKQAQSGADIIFDIKEDGVSVLDSNQLVIPAGSDTSYGFSPAPFVDYVIIENNNRVSFDIVDAGSGATATGAKVTLIGYVIWTTF